MTTSDDPETISSASLWEALRHYIETAFAMFGGPECVALKGLITRREHASILGWLRPLEQALRKLIYAQAVAAPPPPARAASPRAKIKRIRRFIEADPEHPENWRVRFKLLAPVSRGTHGAVSKQDCWINAWPAAERFEALIRAFNNPAPLVRRMARLIARAPARLAPLLVFTPGPTRDPCDFLLEDITNWMPRAPAPNSS